MGNFRIILRGRWPHDGWNDRRQAASVGELYVQPRIVFVEALAELVVDDFEARAEQAGSQRKWTLPGARFRRAFATENHRDCPRFRLCFRRAKAPRGAGTESQPKVEAGVLTGGSQAVRGTSGKQE